MFYSIAQWLEMTDFFTALRGSAYVYPVVMTLHLVGIACFGGMILMTDMRILGWALKGRSISDVVDQLRNPKRIGFVITATCGVLLACSKAVEYYGNPFFRAKLLLFFLVFVHAMIFRGSVYAKAGDFDKAGKVPGRAKLAAALSLILWTSIVIAGRSIGYLEPKLDNGHANAPAVHSVQALAER